MCWLFLPWSITFLSSTTILYLQKNQKKKNYLLKIDLPWHAINMNCIDPDCIELTILKKQGKIFLVIYNLLI